MKGFIEVTISADGDKEFVNVDKIFSIGNSLIFYSIDGDQYLRVKETYDELKALIEEEQKEDGETAAVELAKIVGKKNERKHMIENDCDFCEGGAIRFALKRGGHADDWFDYTRQLTVSDGAINIEVQNELDTEVENIIFEGISHCPFCGKTFQENTEEIEC